MTRSMNVSPTSGGSFATHRPRGSRASTSMAHGQWRNAILHLSAWTSWFCQYLGVPIPQLLLLARQQEADRLSQRSAQPHLTLICP